MNTNVKIIIVDDHLSFREGMKLFIEMEGIGMVVAEAENGRIFLDLLDEFTPDLVLMDVGMPVMGGLESTTKAIAMRPGLKILVLHTIDEKDDINAMRNAGAMGFALKNSGKKELEKAINTVIAGKNYFPD
jgi:DNA-binding NarL/FixJ family response regulator